MIGDQNRTVRASGTRERGQVTVAGRRDPLVLAHPAIAARVGGAEGHHVGWRPQGGEG